MAKPLRSRIALCLCLGALALCAGRDPVQANDQQAEYGQQFMKSVFCAEYSSVAFCHKINRWSAGPLNVLVLYTPGAEQAAQDFERSYEIFSKATGIATKVCAVDFEKFGKDSDCSMAGANILALMPRTSAELTAARAAMVANLPPPAGGPGPVSAFDSAMHNSKDKPCNFAVQTDADSNAVSFVVLLNEVWREPNRSAVCTDGLFNNSIGFWRYDYKRAAYFAKFDAATRIKILYDPALKPGADMDDAAPEIEKLIQAAIN